MIIEVDYSYRSAEGFAARMSRQLLETGVLGRPRTAEEEAEYRRLSDLEVELEFPRLSRPFSFE